MKISKSRNLIALTLAVLLIISAFAMLMPKVKADDTYYLTVLDTDAYIGQNYPEYYPIDPAAVYIDNQYVGTTPVTVQVSAGWHTVAAQETGVWDYFWPYYSHIYAYYEGYGWQYGITSYDTYVSGDTTVIAGYLPDWWL
jgi:hypothetical protein